MKRRIGLFGCMVNNDNLGCCALTYSLINAIEQQQDKYNTQVTYVIFERNPDADKVARLAEDLGIEKERVISEKSERFIRIYNKKRNDFCRQKIAECDIVIDLTQGDSFTDIYGLNRFISYSLDKLTVEKLGIPLILGPQTYGPFRLKLSKLIARKAISNASFVMSRDMLSKEYLDKLGIQKKVSVGTDLAIGLPYRESVKRDKSVGINISGLLWPEKIEQGTETKFSLKCNYRDFMTKTVELFLNEGFTVFLISHVGADYQACREINSVFPNTVLVDLFDTPVDAKTFISGLNLFIGARMHATIAALSTGVPVIPIAYSRKFKGLFNNCKYENVIDLTEQGLEESINEIRIYLNSIDKIYEQITISRNIALEKYKAMIDCLCEKIFMEG